MWCTPQEIEWLRTWMLATAGGEGLMVLPGPGGALVIEREGRDPEVPFGVPLVRLGPGAL